MHSVAQEHLESVQAEVSQAESPQPFGEIDESSGDNLADASVASFAGSNQRLGEVLPVASDVWYFRRAFVKT